MNQGRKTCWVMELQQMGSWSFPRYVSPLGVVQGASTFRSYTWQVCKYIYVCRATLAFLLKGIRVAAKFCPKDDSAHFIKVTTITLIAEEC